MKRLFLTLPLLFLVLLTGCTTVQTPAPEVKVVAPAPQPPRGEWDDFTELGKATYYSDKHANQKTASGQPYKPEQKTAAHKQLPFGSKVKVTNLKSGKSVIVTVNDRGPFAKGRIIDLSKSAFNTIGSTNMGVMDVKIEYLR
jgi:rare lipoprotein A